mmetsp:Transcript_106369/g.183770  ORF Transcript_106369/g.183770 Transcript_106369/m.183770 type:complete len:105 (-) Transcript_106369:17-331(-)
MRPTLVQKPDSTLRSFLGVRVCIDTKGMQLENARGRAITPRGLLLLVLLAAERSSANRWASTIQLLEETAPHGQRCPTGSSARAHSHDSVRAATRTAGQAKARR